ncbi:protein tyrosine phosphatase [Chitinophaga terrae (ex Kim and Jung 2007)]|jgi:protein-tyrosine phosphatase|uniref:protein-tyrosine-phosphatase n=1 Tax=Chitinophaga terrae (ex Kim and Jung 2007) TaxID=408074 RepID=A0A1H4DPG2_9BACT|nr:low molecular weight protein-tyrosine-phosphatase [Chitinophaga terrae (ex Kim and Jung 2007)]SEA74310.1 protein tyrosine phosphatase [Chitinophaga terrae (ex Kim and Jung 2007)]
MKILMVCLGNICRSPLAEGIMRHLAEEKGLDWVIDSAGTGNWHVGQAPDHRAIKEARKNGVDISSLRGRQFQPSDFDAFDKILVMDRNNYRDVIRQARNEADKAKVAFLLPQDQEVPDPWFDDALFAPVYKLIYNACKEIADKK